MLNTSARNCALSRSVTANVLKNDVSSCEKFGPVIRLRPTDPNWPFCGLRHGPMVWPFVNSGLLVPVVANQPYWLGSDAEKSPTKSGRHQPVSRSELQSR